MAGYEEIDFAAVVLVVGEALVDLGFGDFGETIGSESVDRFAVLEEGNHVVNRDARAFHNGVAAANTRGADDVAVGFRSGAHSWMVSVCGLGVNLGILLLQVAAYSCRG